MFKIALNFQLLGFEVEGFKAGVKTHFEVLGLGVSGS